MPKYVFETLKGGRYSAEADTAFEAKDKILKSKPWIRSWDLQLVEGTSIEHKQGSYRSESFQIVDPSWFY